MNLENYSMLQDMLKELIEQRNEVQQKIQSNLFKIEESKVYLQSFLEKEDSDFKIFSPRSIETIHKEEIERIISVQSSYEEENRHLTEVLDKLLSRINGLEKLFKDEKVQNEKLIQIQEDERYRISRDLHDTSLQNLTHLIHKIELSSMFIEQDPLRAKLELSLVNKSLKSIIEEIRNTIFNLRPMEFDDLGLKAAFERLIDNINVDKRYDIDFDIEDVSCENSIVLLTLYRAVQESLNNIVKHAEATRIVLRGKHIDHKYYISIKDNGKGFSEDEIEEKKNSHFGMSLIRERISILNGTVNIQTSESGTNIEIEIPLKSDLIIR